MPCEDIALVPSVSSAAGLIAAQFTRAAPGENLIVGEEEYSSNQFPWRQLAHRGYGLRLVPFRGGGILPGELERVVDDGTKLIAVSAVQTATGHRTDVQALGEIARRRGAWVFVDASQSVGAMDVREDAAAADFMAFSNHKFLLNAGRGMGYLYIRRARQEDLLPLGAGWRAGAEPLQSFFGPRMELSETASRFDASISWLAAIGDEACLGLIEEIGPEKIYQRNNELADHLRDRLAAIGRRPIGSGGAECSHIVSVPLGDADPGETLARLKARGISAAVRGTFLRLAVHFYNNDGDVERVIRAIEP